ncbi:MAG: mannitol dehydrogenase family protein [Oscillospiraceae bacterium]|jgi:fructuronate reductase|nr:mannitol dehydrogenase family protein [Oscillospiraceae bacterium]
MFNIPQAAQPSYDVNAVREATAKAPLWVHFGAGNIFRAFIAALQDDLLNKGLCNRGVIAAEPFDPEIIEAVYRPYGNRALLVTLRADGSTRLAVSASVTEALAPLPGTPDHQRLVEVMEAPSLQMASFTITEKGYRGPVTELLAGLMRGRYRAGGAPLALVSMDNCSRNGELLRSAVLEAAKAYGDGGFSAYLSDPSRVSFPWSMIDKITPAPSPDVQKTLPNPADWSPTRTARGTVVAPFVNAEEPQYLVIEDSFPNGRLPLEKAGVYFTDRETVRRAERMKVTACLNPLHTALAVFGSLLRIGTIADCMKDPDLAALARRIGYDEGLPAVEHPGIFEPKDFLDEVVTKRLVNPFLPDTPARIASDTSQKLPFRFGGTIKAYAAREELSADDLTAIPLVLAGWVRYLMETGDDGGPLALSPDPMLPRLTAALKDVRFGEPLTAKNARAVFADAALFGCDLYAAGLGARCEDHLAAMLKGPGAVRERLRISLSPARPSAAP